MSKTIILFLAGLFLTVNLFCQSWASFSPIQSNPNINGFTVFSIDGKGYLIGGSNGTFSNSSQYNDSIYVYNPLADSWSTFGDFPGTNAVYGNSVSYGNKSYYGFGYDGNSALNVLWEFDPLNGNWTELTSCPCDGRAEIAMLALNDTLYIGLGDNFTTTQFSDWWAYDIANDSWFQKDSFPGQSRHHPQYFALNNEIYVGLGHDDNLGDLETFYKYTPSSDSWLQLNDFPTAIEGPGGQFTYQGEGYVALGLNNTSNNDPNSGVFWKYNPVSDTWTQMPSYNGAGYLSPLTFIINNTAYMVTESNYWNGNGSTDFNKFVFEPITSIDETKLDDVIHIYPNPNTGHFIIDIPGFEEAKLIDQTGRVVKVIRTSTVFIENLEKGIYFLDIKSEKEYCVKTIVVN